MTLCSQYRLRNDVLYCVGWGVKLYSNQTKLRNNDTSVSNVFQTLDLEKISSIVAKRCHLSSTDVDVKTIKLTTCDGRRLVYHIDHPRVFAYSTMRVRQRVAT